jgi:acyl carrier protein
MFAGQNIMTTLVISQCNKARQSGAAPLPSLAGTGMKHLDTVKLILGDSLGVNTAHLCAESLLLGSVPELDSMAVISVIAALEDHFGIAVDDDDITARRFATVGSLTEFVQEMLAP